MSNGTVDVEHMNMILNKTISAIEESQEAIFDIAENARKECNALKRKLEEIKVKMHGIIAEVEKIESQEKKSRNRLLDVSKDFVKYREDDIRTAYEKANQLQIKLILIRQQENDLFRLRNEVEMRYRNSEEILRKAEALISKIGVAMEYLSGNLQDISSTLEDIQQRQNFGKNIIRAQEEERQRVARDIHDGPAQALANVTIKAEICEKLVDIDKERAKTELQELRIVLRDSIKDIRKIIYNLRPMSLDDLGFIPTIQRYIEGFQKESGITVDFIILSQLTVEDPIKNLSIFRIIQEALNNVRKHSKAKQVKIRLEMSIKNITLSVADDGMGFNTEEGAFQIRSDGGFGLFNIRERVELLNGTLQIKSELNKGTRITAIIPNEE
ncbi:sensor histidine kinase [Alkaliphilus peptidifermentans]|uniref:Oxygen sensor histidine kinase NreB n=1 Tax=Alkaliphilus peptidifermentans DSM 18978 TaxID=1120976 RepID=A0A1G5CRR3_9FIRM|nr:sensor histidine kinase [Alkaliphilus peptidifermentans]SCY05076.1 two-component system, NarL family, sensor histidine kinase DegS [Alkaliphilus peptidifermentans DSM 18978]